MKALGSLTPPTLMSVGEPINRTKHQFSYGLFSGIFTSFFEEWRTPKQVFIRAGVRALCWASLFQLPPLCGVCHLCHILTAFPPTAARDHYVVSLTHLWLLQLSAHLELAIDNIQWDFLSSVEMAASCSVSLHAHDC